MVTELTGGRHHGQDMLLESYDNLESSLVTHSGQVNIDPHQRVQQPILNNFMQQAFSQMLYEGGVGNQPLSHREGVPKQAYIMLNP